MQTLDIFTIVTIAFLGSFGHCVGMCGGIVIAYSSTKVSSGWNKTKQSISHILYSIGRITTYMILGAIFGYIGSVMTLSDSFMSIFFILIGILMVLVGLSLLGQLKFLTVIEHTISKSGWYQKSFKQLLKNNSLFSFYVLGMLNGLLPCGFVYFFSISAAATVNPLEGALVMLIFGLSTIPALFSLGFFVGLFKQSAFRNTMIKIAAILVFAYGIHTIYVGYTYIENPKNVQLQDIK